MKASSKKQDDSFVVSVESYENKVMSGRLWSCRGECEQAFASLMELLLLLDRRSAQQDDAAADCRCRRFSRAAQPEAEAEPAQCPEPRRGKRATFRLRILFRRNTSWQGLVTWVEGRQAERFRSALELAVLFDSALCAQEEK